MWQGLPIHPAKASTFANDVDLLYYFLSALTLFLSIAIFTTIFYFAIRYRRRSADEQPEQFHGSTFLEIVWSGIPLLVSVFIFIWSTTIYFRITHPPSNAMQMYVIGKQWMWKIQHPEGRREINELHIPVGRPVKLLMTSEDVIHDFSIPAFRTKMDVVPGRYTQMWFEATQTGEFHLFCSQYCGTKHSGMIGKVVVMEPAEFEQWLAGNPSGETLEAGGERLFNQLFCNTCHKAGPTQRGPSLDGVYNSKVKLETGETVTADEAYLRESILQPAAKVTAGYRPVMPTFQGQVSEEGVLQLISYIKSLKKEQGNK
ncbi:MAG: cytochrome c oxidase subunit II [Acidobacteria bacterium]|nr:cytochrome c oxidase subunit II [Acidobacteriota bacterium]